MFVPKPKCYVRLYTEKKRRKPTSAFKDCISCGRCIDVCAEKSFLNFRPDSIIQGVINMTKQVSKILAGLFTALLLAH